MPVDIETTEASQCQREHEAHDKPLVAPKRMLFQIRHDCRRFSKVYEIHIHCRCEIRHTVCTTTQPDVAAENAGRYKARGLYSEARN
jgi:hypothetical protein